MPWSPLHGAARQGDESAIASLLGRGESLNVPDALGKTPLHQASRYGHVAITAALIRHRADLNFADNGARTPLHVAVSGGHGAIVNTLLQCRADANLGGGHGNAPLHSAVFSGHLEVLKILKQHGADMYSKNEFGQTALDLVHELEDAAAGEVMKGTTCATYLPLDVTRRSLSKNSQPLRNDDIARHSFQSKEVHGMLPLHRATRSGDAKLVGSLIAGGASVDLRDGLGQTPMYKLAACPEASPHAAAMVGLLAQHGADTSACDKSGEALLHVAAAHGHVDMADALLKNGADMNARNGRGQTPLHKAAERGHAHVIERLLALRADANSKDNLDRTALHRSRWVGHSAVVAALTQGAHTKDPRAPQGEAKREGPPALAGELRGPLEVEQGTQSPESLREVWTDSLADLLNKSGGPSFVLEEESRERIAAREALCKTFQASSVPQLIARFQDSRDVIRAHAAMALGRSALNSAVPIGRDVSSVLEAALRTDPSWEVRKETATALGIIGAASPTCQGGLLLRTVLSNHLTCDPSAAVESACHEALNRIFEACPIPELLITIKDKDNMTRKYVVQALAARGAQSPRQLKWQVLDPLESVLYGDVSWDVREYVPGALVQFGLADPLDVGIGAVSIIRNFLAVENVNIMLQQWSSNKTEAHHGTRVKKACEDALATLGLHIAFYGWRKIASQLPVSDFPLPATDEL